MPTSPARKAAYQTLLHMESGHGFAANLLQSQEVSALKDADRRLATEIVMGVLRWLDELDFQIEQLSGRGVTSFDPEVLTALRMGVYQICFLERIPKPAVVNEAVELTKAARKRSAAGLVNAVLRKCEPSAARRGQVCFEELGAKGIDAIQRAVPHWLLSAGRRENGRTLAVLNPLRVSKPRSVWRGRVRKFPQRLCA